MSVPACAPPRERGALASFPSAVACSPQKCQRPVKLWGTLSDLTQRARVGWCFPCKGASHWRENRWIKEHYSGWFKWRKARKQEECQELSLKGGVHRDHRLSQVRMQAGLARAGIVIHPRLCTGLSGIKLIKTNPPTLRRKKFSYFIPLGF